MGTDKASDRIDTLEIRMAYQDETLDALNQAITKQWAQIDKLTRQIEALTGRLSDIEAKATPSPTNERPPHY